MILTGPQIDKEVEAGNITIAPYDRALLNPNSYNYRLGATLLEHSAGTMEPMRHMPGAWMEHRLTEDGFMLLPRRLYLATTAEIIGSSRYVPLLIGRSSMGRLGLFLQVSADLGQLGAVHRWTLELVAVQPIRVYPLMRIGQVSFWMASGDASEYAGFFGLSSDPTTTPPGYNLG